MKKFSFLLTVLALALALGLAFVGCDNGTTSGGERELVTYSGISGDAVYTLTISPPGSRAVLANDAYELTIIQPNGVKRSYGTVKSVGQNTFTLQPAVAGSSSFSVTTASADISGISGDITLENGTTASPPTAAIAGVDKGAAASLNGTWRSSDWEGVDMILNNGNSRITTNGIDGFSGIYIVNGSSFTSQITLAHIDAETAAHLGIAEGSYSKSQLRESVYQANPEGPGQDFENDLASIFATYTGSYNTVSDTLTWGGMTFTRQ